MNNRNKIYKISCIAIIIDQIIKIIIKYNMNLYQQIPIIEKFFSLTYLHNTGAAFSIMRNKTSLLVVLSVIFIIILDRYIKSEENQFQKLEILSLGMIIGGIFGNLLDRIINHAVIDYLSFTIFKYNFPVFNFADICITIGALLLIISTFVKKSTKQEG